MRYVGILVANGKSYKEWIADKATVNSILRHYTKGLRWWQISVLDMFPIDENGNVIDDNPYNKDVHEEIWRQ